MLLVGPARTCTCTMQQPGKPAQCTASHPARSIYISAHAMGTLEKPEDVQST